MVLAAVIATVAAFVISGTYYALVPYPGAGKGKDQTKPLAPALLAGTELARSGAVAALVAGIVSVANWTTTGEGALLGLALWTLPVVLLAGSIVHEGTDQRIACLHAGDWLIKLVAVGAIIGSIS